MKYIIEGGNRLRGAVRISGNKNSVFPCIAASLLTSDEVVLKNMPRITDSEVMIEILQQIGILVSQKGNNTLTIKVNELKNTLPQDLVTKLRGSIVLVGAILARLGNVNFYHPGGDVIGRRSIDVHLEGFRKLGVSSEENGLQFILTSQKTLEKEEKIFLKEASVTGTENIILYCALSDGMVSVKNCASEPSVVDLCRMLIQMGAKIEGVGTDALVIQGVKKLRGTRFRLGDDPIEIGTYAIAAALTKGSLQIICSSEVDMDPILLVLEEFGIDLQKNHQGFVVELHNLKSAKKVKTNLWPGFPTDLMSAVIVLATQVKGETLCHDWMYESRMFFVDKLISMGANITIADPHRVLVYGPSKLQGREMDSPDIRAGMAMVLAALSASGKSVIHGAELIERGYEDVVGKLLKLGAQIEKYVD